MPRYVRKRALLRLMKLPGAPSGWRRLMAAALFRLGGNALHRQGRDNRLDWVGADLNRVEIRIKGDDNAIAIGPGAALRDVRIEVSGNGHRLEIGAGCQIQHARLAFEDAGCVIRIGDATTWEGGAISAVEPGGRIEIGRDCMLSHDLDIRNSDSHSLLDASTGERLNPARDIHIADHVWIGAYAQVLKGVSIGADSVVALRALVTKDVPAGSLAVGMPARVTRTGVTWARERR